MKKLITILSIVLISLFMINVNAKEVQIYFYPEGGKVTTKDFKIVDDYVTYKDGTNYASYKDTDTIKVLNSIKGKKFTLKKSGTYQVFGKEWYTTNYKTNKYFYFDETQTYKVSTIISKLGLTGEEYPVISLFANWDDNTTTIEEEEDKPVDATRITISGSKKEIKVKQIINLKIVYTPSNAKTEKITWTTSDKKIATVSSSGQVKGLSKGTVTITAKTKSGLKATYKLTILENKTNYAIIKYHTNGGNLIVPHGNAFTEKNGYIYKGNTNNISKYAYGTTMSKYGISNYDNPKSINIRRSGYTIIKNKEWNTKKDGTGKTYSQYKVYKASDICDASKKDCTVTLYVNWKKVEEESKSYELAKKAVKETMQAWYMRGSQRQYNSSKNIFGFRHPEDSTYQDNGYSVCSGFTQDVLAEAFGMEAKSSDTLSTTNSPLGSNNYSNQAQDYVTKKGCTTNNDKCKGERVVYFENNTTKRTYYYKNSQTLDELLKVLQPGDVLSHNKSNGVGHVLMVYDVVTNPDTGKKDALLLNSTGGSVIYSKANAKVGGTKKLRFHSDVAPINNALDLTETGSQERNEGTVRYTWLSTYGIFINKNQVRCRSNFERCAITRFYYKDGKDVKYNVKTRQDSINRGILRTKLSGIYISKTSSAYDNNSVYPNQEITYTISITNSSNMTKENMIYPTFYVAEKIPSNATYTYSENAILQNGMVIFRVNALGPGETKTYSYKVKVKDQVGKTVEENGKVYIDNSSDITTGTIKHTIIKKPKTLNKSYKTCYNSLKDSKKGVYLIDSIYKCVHDKDIKLSKFDTENMFEKTILDEGEIERIKIVNNEYTKMILNNYWNKLTYNKSKSDYYFPTWGSTYVESPRAQTIDSNHFRTGDVLIYKVDNSKTDAKYRFTNESGLYAYIYIDGKFIGVNGSGKTARNEYTPNYYKSNNLDINKYLCSDKNNTSENDLKYYNYQALFGKDYYMILRPEITL